MKVLIFTFVLIFFLSSSVLGRRVICYFPNWAGYRQGDGKFSPNELDPSKCTNVLYAFAYLTSDSTNITPSDSWADISLNYYTDIVKKSKAAGAKPSLSLGGWTDSGGKKYSILLNDASKRQVFVRNAVAYLQKYGFEGLDIDIENPSCPQGDCARGNPNDKQGFAALIKELSQVFKPKGWVLSAAITSEPSIIDRAYDIKAMNAYMDWIGVMTYDYHISSSASETGPVSPLKRASGDKYPNANTMYSINYLLSQGADRSKLLVGVPSYGYSYKLKSSSNNGYWAPSNGAGIAGPYTKSSGILAYYEICDLMRNQGYKNVENSDLGAYAYKDVNWVSYNSRNDVLNKVNYVKNSNLGGVIVWDTSFDDFTGKFCGSGKNPLLTAMKSNIN